MDIYGEVNERLLFWGRLAGLKAVYSDVKEKRWITLLATFAHFAVVLSIVDFIFYTRRFANKNDIIKLVANVLIIMMLLIGLSLYIEMKRVEDEFFDMTNTLKKLHFTDVPCLKEIYSKHFSAGYKNCNLLIKVIGGMAVFAELAFTSLGSGLNYMVEKSSYPLPCFWQISFYPATDKVSYGVNMVTQAILCGITIFSFVCNSTYIYYISSSTIAKLETTIDMVKEMDMISAELTYNGWVAQVTESICEVKQILIFAREKYNVAYYLFEKMSYVALFISFVIFKIDPAQMGTCFAGLMIVQGLLIMVLLNEQFLTKFEELNAAIYNLNWFEMKAKERKPLILMIQASSRYVSLSAGGLNDLTLQWFGGLMQAGYSAGLVLQDLLK